MLELAFKSLLDMQDYFNSKEGKIFIHKKLYEFISSNAKSDKKTIHAFNIYIEDHDVEFDVTLPKSEWGNILNRCFNVFEEFDMSDETIDCYLLIKKNLF
jgi:hypothetical protein